MIKFVKGDITKQYDVEAIVNAANRTLIGGGGVDGAIHKAAGIKLGLECLKMHGCKVGQAKLTKGYKLPCRYVIHTVGPRWRGGGKNEATLLTSCYRSALMVAKEHGIRTIAFPSVSTGIYKYPVELAAETGIYAVNDFLLAYPDSFDLVKWVLYSDDIFNVYQNKAMAILEKGVL